MEDYPFWVTDYYRPGQHLISEYPELKEIFDRPIAVWLTHNTNNDPRRIDSTVKRLLKRSNPKLPVFVVYNLPNRDLGGYSKGGSPTVKSYLNFIYNIASAIGDKNPIVVFEPDAVPHLEQMNKRDKKIRIKIISKALDIFKDNSNARVYLDVGHSNWLTPKKASKYIKKIGKKKISGFSINVSNYRTTKESLGWGLEISRKIKKGFIIDTSRNGRGPKNDEWCNPAGRGLGIPATTNTGNDWCDAFIWIKVPGESDGECNGGPKAGRFWLEQSLELISNADFATI